METVTRADLDLLLEKIVAHLEAMELRSLERFAALKISFELNTAGAEVAHPSQRVSQLPVQVGSLADRIDRLDAGVLGLTGRIDALSDDLRQRFRVMNDRLAQLAA